jgi:endo-1,3(4)-beta-glucanase
MYPIGASLDASVTNDVGTYSINYETAGNSASGEPLIYVYPHLVESFTSSTASAATSCQVQSTTKGMMTAVKSSKIEMSENLNPQVQWLPYSVNATFSGPSWSQEALQNIAAAANSELAQNMSAQSNTDSTYTSGKVFDKFAYIVLVAKEVLGNDEVAQAGLNSLIEAFSRFTTNNQQVPLMYDTLMKGVTSSAANQEGGSPLDDYGSPFYNDHHFHYGYMVHCAAVVGYVDKALGGNWIEENKDWVNSLVRDVANPSNEDTYFPVFRMFDWFHGHSWAAGLFVSADGKNEESSSEDYNFAYGMKMWGMVVGDQAMEARGDLMLAVMKRSMNAYFLMENNNVNQPWNFIDNRVPGITFENKCDHTTYFGTLIEYIQGIHMIPITPASGLIRSAAFCSLEWADLLASVIDSIDSGWAGILRSNQALFDPITAYNWFAQSNFPSTLLDDGASLTWYLTLSAGLGGSSA